MSETLQNRFNRILSILKKYYPGARTALKFGNPLEILVATILSAQCTDERVNKVTEVIFKKYKTVRDYAKADIHNFEQDIKSTGFYHNKAKNITESAKIILEKYDGKVPDTMADLLTLPGVARKTANIVLGNAYGRIEGIAVDTHVRRLSQRLALTKSDNPVVIELDLMKITPRAEWVAISNLLIEHGRKICNAKKPKCPECSLGKRLCPSFNKT
ncbi:MAG: endonuclease III [Elusimicrobia bacterium]|nr:endonuclease III [Elusimicrobiota bacterium]